MSTVPGLISRHAVITPACREKGDMVAFEEAVERLRQDYARLIQHWRPGSGASFHLVLSVDYPRGADPAGGEEP